MVCHHVRSDIVKSAKKAKLQAAGWSVGSADEFLSASQTEAVIVDVREALSSSLRELRLRRGLTQSQVAMQLGSSQSRLAKMEAADSSVTIDLLMHSLVALGLTRKQLAQAIAK
jgi:hypothetical protein